jgi:hypothetical protein
LVGPNQPATTVPEDRGESRCLGNAGLDDDDASGGEPGGQAGRDPAVYVEPVGAAVERDQRLVVAGLGRHQCDLRRRHVGSVRHEYVDPAADIHGQGGEEVAGEHPVGAEVAPGTGERGFVDVGGEHLDVGSAVGERRRRCGHPATELDHERARRRTPYDLVDQDLAAAPGHEDARRDRDPESVELDPAEDGLERLPSDPPGHHRLE